MPSARTRGARLLTAIGVAVFAVSALLVHTGATAWDRRVFRSLNEVPSSLASVMTPIARLCALGALVIAAALAAAYLVLRNRTAFPVLVGSVAAAAAWGVANLAKIVADRPRPYEVVGGAALRQAPAHGSSFPSSHTAVVLAIVLGVSPFVSRPAFGVAVAYACLVAWSRVYLGFHYPLDVLAGAGIGMAVGGAVLLVLDRRASH
jgi:membrane-associated phospholipid phosphatase